MIPFEEAFHIVMSHLPVLGTEQVPLSVATGRFLAEKVVTDRDLPPFDRVTMDGICICFQAYGSGQRAFRIAGEARAGSPGAQLADADTCLEVMTGAVLPRGADTVIRYEDLRIESGMAHITAPVTHGQNIHPKGSDAPKDTLLLIPGTRIGPAEVSTLASVGKANVLVYGLPRTTVLSTGDELVEVDQEPLPHQIRRSNVYALQSALQHQGIRPVLRHLPDHPDRIREGLQKALGESDALIISGGVSMGKYDFLPEILEELGVERYFHRVAQKPGKPFWFGIHRDSGCGVFSLPGNPVSTFLNFHLYFREWVWRASGRNREPSRVLLAEPLQNPGPLTVFKLARVVQREAGLLAIPVAMNSSGDFSSLTKADGFIRLEPGKDLYPAGSSLPFLFFNNFGM